MSAPAHSVLMAAMARGEFYGEDSAPVQTRQTHISCVFLTAAYAYKIKKPLRFAFVDYSTLAARYAFCQEELRLNSRLAPRVYLGVYPIYRRGQEFALGLAPSTNFDPAAFEYLVKMRRLAETRTLQSLIAGPGVSPAAMAQIGERLARFHRSVESARSSEFGSPAAVARVVGDNLQECRALVGSSISAQRFDAIASFYQRFLARNQELLAARAARGMTRDGHGDLRAEHIYLDGLNGLDRASGDAEPESNCATVEIVDCVEFNQALRYIDVASDLAFLLMDLDRLEAPHAGHQVLQAYLKLSGDPELSRLLSFYKCHRALVRAKVSDLKTRQEPQLSQHEERESKPVPSATGGAEACLPGASLQGAGGPERAQAFCELAYTYAKAGSPALIVVCGLSGSGKSLVARHLAERTGWQVFNSDLVRKQLAGLAPEDRGGERAGIYRPEWSRKTYDELFSRAARELHAGQGAILDATFQKPPERARAQALAQAHGVPLLFAECLAPGAIIAQRLAARASAAGEVSDATMEIHLAQKRAWVAFDPALGRRHLVLDSRQEPARSAREVECGLAAAD